MPRAPSGLEPRVALPPQLTAVAAAGPAPNSVLHRLSGRTMGTGWVLSWSAIPMDEGGRRQLLSLVQTTLDALVAQMSHWAPDSLLSQFNAAAPGSRFALPPAFATVLECALDIAADTGGAFDPTLGAAADGWGFGPRGAVAQPPTEAQQASLRARTGWQRLDYEPRTRCLTQTGGMQLDFSAIAKGYAVDTVAAIAQRWGLVHHLVEIGGELRGQGCKPDGQPWWVDVEEVPGAPCVAGTLRIALDGAAIATSGDYRRSFEENTVRFAHTLDPRSARPLAQAPALVSVLAADAMRADALATALTVMGRATGLEYADAHGLAVVFRERDHAGDRCLEYRSTAFERWLS